jgi:hypothetical protein
MWRPSLTKLFVAHSKKQAQAAPQTSVGDPSEEERGFRVEDGRDSGPLRRTLRPPASGGLLRRASLPTHRRCERPPADEAGVHRALRFGVRARRGLLGSDELRAIGWLARAGSHRAPQEARVRPVAMRRLVEEHTTHKPKRSEWSWTTSRLIPVRPSTRTSQQKMLASWLEGSSFATRRYMAHG